MIVKRSLLLSIIHAIAIARSSGNKWITRDAVSSYYSTVSLIVRGPI